MGSWVAPGGRRRCRSATRIPCDTTKWRMPPADATQEIPGTRRGAVCASRLSAENPAQAGHAIVGDFSEIAGATYAERTDARMPKALLKKSWHWFEPPPVSSRRISDFGFIRLFGGGRRHMTTPRRTGNSLPNPNGVAPHSPGLPARSGLPWDNEWFGPQPQRGCVRFARQSPRFLARG